MSEVEVIIPHFDRRESLRDTLDSLRAQTAPAAITVVDNASQDGSVEMLASEFSEVRVIRLSRNHGFGAAINRGVKRSTARLVIFLNNDARADERFVEEMVATERETGASMVAGCLRAPGGMVETLGVELDSSLNVYDVGFGLAEPLAYRGSPPLGPSGGACLFEREAFLRAAGFDEALFAYLEDADLAIRMRLEGESCVAAPRAFAWHDHSTTLGPRSARKNELLGFARAHLLWKYGAHLPRRDRIRGVAADGIVYLGKAAIDRNGGALRGRVRHRRFRRGRPASSGSLDVRHLPLVRLTLIAMLRRRLARRL
jgi:GT2 family glycosyltransferase